MKKLKHISLFENFNKTNLEIPEITYSELSKYIVDIIHPRNNEILYIQTDDVSRTIARLSKDHIDILILDFNTVDIYEILEEGGIVILVGGSLDNISPAISNKFTQVYLID